MEYVFFRKLNLSVLQSTEIFLRLEDYNQINFALLSANKVKESHLSEKLKKVKRNFQMRISLEQNKHNKLIKFFWISPTNFEL